MKKPASARARSNPSAPTARITSAAWFAWSVIDRGRCGAPGRV